MSNETSMECEFVVGQKVVCVKEGNWFFADTLRELMNQECAPRRGDICQIEMIYQSGEHIFLLLIGYPMGCGAIRFRPLAASDISVFDAILADVNAGKVKPVTVPA